MMPMIAHSRRVSRDRSIALTILGMFAPLLFSAPRARQDASPPPVPPGFGVKILAQPLRATVGDPIQIDLEFTLPQGYTLQFPHLPEKIGEFTVMESLPGLEVPSQERTGKTVTPPEGQVPGPPHLHARIVAAVYKTGEFEFPALPFVMRDGEGKEVGVSSPPVKIQIESILTDKDLDLRDLKKQADIEEPIRWLLWVALGISALVITLAGWWWIRHRRRPAVFAADRHEIDPLDQADADLRDLVGRGLLEKGRIKLFYICLSDIIKKALEASYNIQTVEKTTSEIVAALANAGQRGAAGAEPSDLELIETLLLTCDMVKFARYTPSAGEHDKATKEALQILVNCRTRRQQAILGTAPATGVS